MEEACSEGKEDEVCSSPFSNVGKRDGNSLVQREVDESVGLARGDSMRLEFLPSAEGVKVAELPEGRRRCVVEVEGVALLERD